MRVFAFSILLKRETRSQISFNHVLVTREAETLEEAKTSAETSAKETIPGHKLVGTLVMEIKPFA